MKKLILTATVIAALAAASLQTARAGDREWATVGKVLTGVAAAGLVVAALDNHPAPCTVSYSYTVPFSPPPAVVYAPSPRVVYVPARPVVVVADPMPMYSRPVLVSPQRFAARPDWHGHW